MKPANLFVVMFGLVSFIFSVKADDPKILTEDLSMLLGDKWKGMLTYTDFTSGKKITIGADLTVIRAEPEGNIWIFKNEYPDEPSANSVDSIAILEDGRKIKDETVRSRLVEADMTVQIITEKSVVEKEVQKIFRYTYTISPKKFSIKKEEKNEDAIVFTQRNIFEYSR